jgi:hypothetical protein
MQWIGVGVILVLTVLFGLWVRQFRLDALVDQLKMARDEVADSLSVQPLPFLSNVVARSVSLEIMNNAHWSIGKHTISCNVHSMWDVKDARGFGRTSNETPAVLSLGLLGGGRGELIECPSQIAVAPPITCSDMSVDVKFIVKEQPEVSMIKHSRYFYRETAWYQGQLDKQDDYCAPNF